MEVQNSVLQQNNTEFHNMLMMVQTENYIHALYECMLPSRSRSRYQVNKMMKMEKLQNKHVYTKIYGRYQNKSAQGTIRYIEDMGHKIQSTQGTMRIMRYMVQNTGHKIQSTQGLMVHLMNDNNSRIKNQ